MLVGESQGFDVKEVRLTQEPIDVNREGMCGELGIQASTQAPKSMRMISFNLELLQ